MRPSVRVFVLFVLVCVACSDGPGQDFSFSLPTRCMMTDLHECVWMLQRCTVRLSVVCEQDLLDLHVSLLVPVERHTDDERRRLLTALIFVIFVDFSS